MDRFLEGIITGIANGRRDIYNPTVFYGDVSEINAIITRLIQDHLSKHPIEKIVQISGEEFSHKVILSFVEHAYRDFGKQFENTDLLVFENVQIIAGRITAMEKFYGIFDKVYESGGQIVVTSTVPPAGIIGLDNRIRAQLEGGMIWKVRAHDFEGV